VKINAVELRRVNLPLVTPFRTSFGTQTTRTILLVRVITPDSEGWSECVALSEPVYSPEYIDGAQHVIVHHLLPRLFAASDVTANRVTADLAAVKGHQMAKAALETAVLDAELKATGMSFGSFLGATKTRVPSGVSVGIMDSIDALIATVEGYVAEGYLRIKLKIEPGWDVEPVRAIRERFGDELLLQTDANTAYTLRDAPQLAKMDPFDLLLIEQPLPEHDLAGHAELAKLIKTPICLDESIESAAGTAEAIARGAVAVVNIKPGRVGGYLESRRIAAVCAANAIPVWCGGMLESGIGRAANVALAALPEFTLPGDTSASNRYYAQDLTEPFVLRDGHLDVPKGPGIGVAPLPELLAELTSETRLCRP
jgi:O-succinylbenzoate synthase